MKILFGNETKRIPDEQNYSRLLQLVTDAFHFPASANLGTDLHFYYVDQDGDIISVSNQNDLNEAIKEMQNSRVKLVLANNFDVARQAIATSEFLKSEMLNQSCLSQNSANGIQFGNVGQKIHSDMVSKLKAYGSKPAFKEDNKMNTGFATERHSEKINSNWLKTDPNTCLDNFFTEDKSDQIHSKATHSIGCGGESPDKTYQNSFGCNTDGVFTSDKMVGAIQNTNECGS